MSTTQTLSTKNPAGEADIAKFDVFDGKTWAIVNGKHMFRVTKTEVGNPSARGGAYTTVWVARGRGHVVTRDTRKAATEAMVEHLRSKGFTV